MVQYNTILHNSFYKYIYNLENTLSIESWPLVDASDEWLVRRISQINAQKHKVTFWLTEEGNAEKDV